MIWTLGFWRGAGERAFKTLAQALLAVFVVGVPIFDVDIRAALAVAATAVVASLLTSVLNADFTAGATGKGFAGYTPAELHQFGIDAVVQAQGNVASDADVSKDLT